MPPVLSIKDAARRVIDDLPEDATWEDLEYQIYVHRSIEAGLKDAAEGRMVSDEEARRRFGLPPG